MRTIRFTLALVGSLLLAAGCASTQITQTWKNPTAAGFRPSKVLVAAVVPSEAIRRHLEDRMATELSREGIQAVPSYRLLPADEKPARENAHSLVNQDGFDALLVTTFEGIEERVTYQPGWGYEDYLGWRGPLVYAPGYFTTTRAARMETSLFDTRGKGQLVWTADTKTFDPSAVDKEVPRFVSTIVHRLNKDVLS